MINFGLRMNKIGDLDCCSDYLLVNKIKHTEINYRDLDRLVASMNVRASKLLTDVNEMKHTGLSIEDMRKLARNAASLRYVV